MTETPAPAPGGQGAPAGGAAAALLPGAPAPGAAAPAPAPAPAPGPGPESIPWLPGADETLVGYVKNKGWQEPGQVLEGYRNLEKLLGADRAGRTVVMPKEGATPEEMGAFFDRLGRPTDPSGYKIEVPPEIGDPEFAKAAAARFHELGLSKSQGESLVSWWNESAKAQMQAFEQTQMQARQQAAIDLQREWGAAFTQNTVLVDNAARALGLDEAAIGKLGSALGPKGAMDLLYKIGAKMGESNFVAGTEKEGFGAMTPAQAKAEIESLKVDKGFWAKLVAKDAAANEKWLRLHQYAYPEGR